MKKGNPQDMYMQFLRGLTGLASVNVKWATNEIMTGCGYAPRIAMEIHLIEMHMPSLVVSSSNRCFYVGAKDIVGLDLADGAPHQRHCLAFEERSVRMLTEGAIVYDHAVIQKFSPPLIYAEASLYFGFNVTDVEDTGALQTWGRVGFTYVTLTPEKYMEVLESYRSW